MKKRTLILCTGNSVRGQMAEGLLRHIGNAIDGQVKSAGRIPTVAEITGWLATAAVKEELYSKEA